MAASLPAPPLRHALTGSMPLARGRCIESRHVHQIASHGYSRWSLGAIAGRIKDWFCSSDVERAKELIAGVMDSGKPATVRLECFTELRALVTEPYRQFFTLKVIADAVELDIVADDAPLVHEVLAPSAVDLGFSFAELEIAPKLSEHPNVATVVDAYVGRDFGRSTYVIESELFDVAIERSAEEPEPLGMTRPALEEAIRSFLANRCYSDFQRSAVAMLCSQFSLAVISTRLPCPPDRSNLGDMLSEPTIEYEISSLMADECVRLDIRYRKTNSQAFLDMVQENGEQKPSRRTEYDGSFLIGRDEHAVACFACDARYFD